VKNLSDIERSIKKLNPEIIGDEPSGSDLLGVIEELVDYLKEKEEQEQEKWKAEGGSINPLRKQRLY